MNDEALSALSAFAINGLIFAGMAFASLGAAAETPADKSVEWVEFEPVEVQKLGEKRPENQLPRIVENPEPPPPETDVASLSRKQKEQEELEKKKEEEKKKRELAEKKRRDEEKRKKDEARRKKEEEELERKRRKKRMRDALRKLKDPRADEDNPDGDPNGDVNGNSANARRNKATYITRVAGAIRHQFEIPTVIPPDVRKKLVARVHFKFGKDGKLIGKPKLLKSSGNKLFDQAALRALNKFGPGSQIRFPIPPFSQPALRKSVFANGLRMEMTGRDG